MIEFPAEEVAVHTVEDKITLQLDPDRLRILG